MPSPLPTCQPCSKTIVDAATPNVLQNLSNERVLQHAHYVVTCAASMKPNVAAVGYSRVSTIGEHYSLQNDAYEAAGCDYTCLLDNDSLGQVQRAQGAFGNLRLGSC